MIFFLNLILSILYCNYIARKGNVLNKYDQFCLYLPLLFCWTLLCGSQFYVGTDYASYMELFNGHRLEFFLSGGEVGFVYFIKFLNLIGLRGQSIYFIIYFILFITLYGILKNIEVKYWGLFVLLYIVVSAIFNNQLNIVRQSLTVYLGTYSGILIYKGKIFKGLLLIAVSTLFHISAIFFLVFFFIPRKLSVKLPRFFLVLSLVLCICLGSVMSTTIVGNLLDFMPANYAWYIQSGGIEEISFINKLSKYIYVPLYLLSIYLYPKYQLSRLEIWMYNWGIIGFAFRVLIMNLQIINRLSFIFLIISIFPLFYLLRFLCKKKMDLEYNLICNGIVLFYGIKVLLMPSNEYAYDSIFFHFI